jgi:4-oxalocrotonate tautomerase family enzyme
MHQSAWRDSEDEFSLKAQSGETQEVSVPDASYTGGRMPVIIYESLPVNAEQKATLIRAFTEATTTVAKVAPHTVVVLFHDLPAESIGSGGRPLSEVCAGTCPGTTDG